MDRIINILKSYFSVNLGCSIRYQEESYGLGSSEKGGEKVFERVTELSVTETGLVIRLSCYKCIPRKQISHLNGMLCVRIMGMSFVRTNVYVNYVYYYCAVMKEFG